MIEGNEEQLWPKKNRVTGKEKRLEDRRWKLILSNPQRPYGVDSIEYHRFKLTALWNVQVFCSGSSPIYTKAVIIDQKPKGPRGPFRVTEIE